MLRENEAMKVEKYADKMVEQDKSNEREIDHKKGWWTKQYFLQKF